MVKYYEDNKVKMKSSKFNLKITINFIYLGLDKLNIFSISKTKFAESPKRNKLEKTFDVFCDDSVKFQ